MPVTKTTGVVIKRTNLGEADRIITLLTPEGKHKAVAKGVRRIKSRMAGHLELFSHSQVMLAAGRNLDTLTSARLIDWFEALSSDYQRLAYSYLLAEMVDKLVDEKHHQPELYHLILECYHHLNQTGGDALLELYFKLRLLDQLGYHPELSVCVICHAPVAGEGSWWFDSQQGGLVDGTCATLRTYPMTPDQIKVWRLVLGTPLADLLAIANTVGAASASLVTIDGFYDHLFGKRFKSRQIFGAAV